MEIETGSCGLGQDNPLLPCLFIICAEDLSSLLRQAEEHGDIHVIAVCKGYEEASRQSINYQKWSIMFTPNMNSVTTGIIQSILGVESPIDHECYLGLPSLVGTPHTAQIIPSINSTFAINAQSSPFSLIFILISKPKAMSQTVVLKVGMSCEGCVGAVKRVLGKMEGVESYEVDLKEQKVTVKGQVEPDAVLQMVSKTGKRTTFWDA
ncbi:hypothetical protein PVK06_001477 [Gossypium arboreum]|uniref:HMA domain-containing protein n=1 Tax=Gossypium arboreum TaxID=29729 RepID=A0ABR0R180_GOSAR|nr:hypothetical protein PVK06_001477 [Gossypium arboreum]